MGAQLHSAMVGNDLKVLVALVGEAEQQSSLAEALREVRMVLSDNKT